MSRRVDRRRHDRQSELEIDQLQPGKYQPRTHMDEAALKELAASIKAQGVMQPILVRPGRRDGRYEIIAGERRWRAAKHGRPAKRFRYWCAKCRTTRRWRWR